MYTTQAGMFEGLFVRALAVTKGSPFAGELRSAGFDLEDVQHSYDISIWVACVDVAWRNTCPQLSRDEAWHLLGRRFIEGYFHTAIGGFIAAALPYMTVERFLERVPWFLRTGLGGSSAEVEVGDHRATVTLVGPHPRSATLLAGVLEVCFERLGAQGTFQAKVIGGDDSQLDVTWEGGR